MATLLMDYSIHVRDADGESTSTNIFIAIDDATTLSALQLSADALAVEIDNILDGKVEAVGVSFKFVPSGVKANPVAGSEIERTGLLTFDTTAERRNWSIDLPAFAAALFVGNEINLADTSVTTFTDDMVDGGYCDAYKNDIIAVLTGRKTFRKHRRQTRRT